jgi:hypothetical protein
MNLVEECGGKMAVKSQAQSGYDHKDCNGLQIQIFSFPASLILRLWFD